MLIIIYTLQGQTRGVSHWPIPSSRRGQEVEVTHFLLHPVWLARNIMLGWGGQDTASVLCMHSVPVLARK